MRSQFPKLPESLVRMGVVAVLFVATVLFARWMIPASLKNGEEHRDATVAREAARPIRFAGANACIECHEEQQAARQQGYHHNLSCETCHGASFPHSDNPDVLPATYRRRDACTRCHQYDASRPTGFPQINPVAHNPRKQCISCHKPHDPKPPRVPQECSACHAQIAATKEASPHGDLACTSCHTVDAQHKVAPREVRARIPNDRSVCARCHATDSREQDTQKVDVATHGEKYVCWRCHYPHMPELNSPYGPKAIR